MVETVFGVESYGLGFGLLMAEKGGGDDGGGGGGGCG